MELSREDLTLLLEGLLETKNRVGMLPQRIMDSVRVSGKAMNTCSAEERGQYASATTQVALHSRLLKRITELLNDGNDVS